MNQHKKITKKTHHSEVIGTIHPSKIYDILTKIRNAYVFTDTKKQPDKQVCSIE